MLHCVEMVFSHNSQESWTNASKKQREKLLELIRRLAEDDKEGVMAHKVQSKQKLKVNNGGTKAVRAGQIVKVYTTMVKNPSKLEANLLAIYKYGGGRELKTFEDQSS